MSPVAVSLHVVKGTKVDLSEVSKAVTSLGFGVE